MGGYRWLLPCCAGLGLAAAADGNQPPSFTVPDLVAGTQGQSAPLLIPVTGALPGPAAESGQSIAVLAAVEAVAGGPALSLAAVTRTTPEGVLPAAFSIALAVHGGYGDASVLVVADDGTATATALTTRRVRVHIARVDAMPVFRSSAPAVVAVGGSVVLGSSNLLIADPDTASADLRFVLTGGPVLGRLRTAAGPLAVGGAFTAAELAAGDLVYDSTAGAGTDGFAATVSDGSTTIGPFPVTVVVGDAVRQVVPGAGGTWSEGGGPVAVMPAAQVVENGSAAGTAASVRVAVADGGRTGDLLSLADRGDGLGKVGVVGEAISYDGAPAGTWSGGGAGRPLVLAITAGGAIEGILQAVRFDHLGHDPGDARRISVSVDDGAPAEVALTLLPVDDPPVVTTVRIAAALGVLREVALAAQDPDSTALTWAVAGQPDNAVVSMLDAAAGRLHIVPIASGRSVFTVTVADATSTVLASIVLVVTGADDARPHAAGSLPHDGYAGEAVSVDLPWDLRDLPADASLAFSATGAPPGDLVLTPLAADRVQVAFTIPAAAGPQPVFGLLAEDAASGAAAHLPVHLLVRPRPETRR